jgi:4,5-dihydroxyphthalate decarboxylase
MVKLTLGFARNLRIEPLVDGSIKPQNIELDFVMSPIGELFYRNLEYDEFDLSEMSLSAFVMARERRDGAQWQWTGLPVFLSKAFHIWEDLFVHTGANIRGPEDLQGKRIGVPDYLITAVIWMRIFLKELYGIKPQDITWYLGRPKEFSHTALFGLDKNPPPGVSLHWLTEDQSFDIMLDRGELDAAYGFFPRIAPTAPSFRRLDRYGGTPISGNPRIRKFLPDGGREVITAYYRQTGVLPANHFFFVQNRILEEHPWVALELYKAFQRSKEMAYERAQRLRSTYLLFEGQDRKSQAETFGPDVYPLGLRANRTMLELLFHNCYEEGLTQKLAAPEDVLARTTWDT